MIHDFDVIIIGASLAGSAVAIHLAQHGISAALIDQHTFPRRKACGEGLSQVGVTELRHLGLSDSINALSHSPFSGYTLWFPTRRSSRGDLPINLSSADTFGIGIERYLLDQLLADAATSVGTVTPFFGEKVREVVTEQNTFSVELAERAISAPLLVLACGTNIPIASKLGFECRTIREHRFGASVTVNCALPHQLNTVQIIAESGYQIFVTPVSKTGLNLSVLADKQSSSRIRLNSLASHWIQVSSLLSLSGEIVSSPSASSPVNNACRAHRVPGMFLVGDSYEVLDPIGGMGMSHALVSARLASLAIKQIVHDRVLYAESLRRYVEAHERATKPLRGFTRLVQFMLTNRSNRGLTTFAKRIGIALPIAKAVHSGRATLTTACARELLNVIGRTTNGR